MGCERSAIDGLDADLKPLSEATDRYRSICAPFDVKTRNRLGEDAPQAGSWRLHFNALTRVKVGIATRSRPVAFGPRHTEGEGGGPD